MIKNGSFLSGNFKTTNTILKQPHSCGYIKRHNNPLVSVTYPLIWPQYAAFLIWKEISGS
jgi:hypothetical protein